MTDPWTALKNTLIQFHKEYPHLTIGKIEIWDLGGATAWKKKITRKQWQEETKAKLREERVPSEEK